MDVFTLGSKTYAAVVSSTDDGLQIIDVTDPASPTAAGSLGDDNTMLLDGATGVDVFTLGSNTYVAVVSDDGLQIIDVTTPASPTAAGSLGDDNTRLLDGATGVDVFTLGSNTYAAVASGVDDGLQIIDVTTPASPTAAGSLEDDNTRLLDGATGVDVFTLGSNTYAAVASYTAGGLQIVDVTDTDNLVAAGSLEDDNTRLLDGAADVDVFTTGGNTYAAVASDDGLQIIDVTTPASPSAAGSLGGDNSRLLDGATGVDVFTLDSSAYAAVAFDDGLQIVDVTVPANPAAVASLGDDSSRLLDGATGVSVFKIGSDIYAAVVSQVDNGLQILRLGAEAAPNSPPVAPSETATTAEDTPATITPAISDPDASDTPIISAVDDPPHGTAAHDDTTITYTPDQDYFGTDTFGYTVSDGTDTAQGTITVTVTRGNNAPVMGAIGDRTAMPGIQLIITPSVTDADQTDTHTYSIARGTLPAAAVFNRI